MSTEKRLERVVSALDVRQRAAMFLRDYKAGLAPDPNAVRFNTDDELREFWRLVGIIDFCNDDLAQIVLLVREQVMQEALRVNWLKTARLYAGVLDVCRSFLAQSVPEPVTASEARTRKEPKCGFRIYPDSERTEVEMLRRDRRFVDQLARSWGAFNLPLAPGTNTGDVTVATGAAEIAWLAREAIAVHWTHLRAVDSVLKRYAAEFGEDPLQPALRACLDGALAEIAEIREELVPFTGPWELPADYSEPGALLAERARRVLL